MAIFYLPIRFNESKDNIDFKHILTCIYQLYSLLREKNLEKNNIVHEDFLSYYINKTCKWNKLCTKKNCKYFHEDQNTNLFKIIDNLNFWNFINDNFNISIIYDKDYKYIDNNYTIEELNIIKITDINKFFKLSEDILYDLHFKGIEGSLISLTFKKYHIELNPKYFYYLNTLNEIISIIYDKIGITYDKNNFINYFQKYIDIENERNKIISEIPLKDWIIKHHCVRNTHPNFNEWKKTDILFDNKSKELLEESYYKKILYLCNGINKYQLLIDAYSLSDEEFIEKHRINKPEDINLYKGIPKKKENWLRSIYLPIIKKKNLPKSLKNILPLKNKDIYIE